MNNISDSETKIKTIPISTKIDMRKCVKNLDKHLSLMLKADLLSNNEVSNFTFDWDTYISIEQFILEEIDILEERKEMNKQVPWELIDNAKIILRTKLNTLLQKEKESQYEIFKPFLKFMISTYENMLIYDSLHPNSLINPWSPMVDILLDKGYFYLISDNIYILLPYVEDRNVRMKIDSNENKLSLVIYCNGKFDIKIIDEKYDLQFYIYQYLKQEAFGKNKSKKVSDITNYIRHIPSYIQYSNDNSISKALDILENNLLILKETDLFFVPEKNDLSFLEEEKELQRKYHYHTKKANYFGKMLELKKTNKLYQ